MSGQVCNNAHICKVIVAREVYSIQLSLSNMPFLAKSINLPLKVKRGILDVKKKLFGNLVDLAKNERYSFTASHQIGTFTI
jgi:hypothetical protein